MESHKLGWFGFRLLGIGKRILALIKLNLQFHIQVKLHDKSSIYQVQFLVTKNW